MGHPVQQHNLFGSCCGYPWCFCNFSSLVAQVYAGLQITRSRIPETSGRIIAGHIWGHVEFKPHHTKEPYRNNSLSRSLLNTFFVWHSSASDSGTSDRHTHPENRESLLLTCWLSVNYFKREIPFTGSADFNQTAPRQKQILAAIPMLAKVNYRWIPHNHPPWTNKN